MASQVTAAYMFKTLCEHLGKRDDLWHVVNGPKRETWFNAETIAALSRIGPGSLAKGFRVFGEESYSEMYKMCKDYNIPCSQSLAGGCDEDRRMPDVSILEGPCSDTPSLTITENKLISPGSTVSDDDVVIGNDVDSQLKTLGRTKKCDGLLDQLDRASHLIPSAQVYGLIFAVHRLGQCEQASPGAFFGALTQRVPAVFAATAWRLWDDKVKPVAPLQNIPALGGMFNGQASLGIGILIAR